MICARVSAAREAKDASSWTRFGGPDVAGCASATMRRITMATAIVMQIQKPVRSQRGKILAAGTEAIAG